MEAGSTATGDRIWLVAPDWQVRALARAQLKEEGYAVLAMESWEELEALLQEEEVMAPGLLIAALTGDEPPAVRELLRGFPARRLVLRDMRAPSAEAMRAAGIEAVLSRPYSVGDVARAARELLRRPPCSSPRLSSGRRAVRSPAPGSRGSGGR